MFSAAQRPARRSHRTAQGHSASLLQGRAYFVEQPDGSRVPSPENAFAYFQHLSPASRVGYSILPLAHHSAVEKTQNRPAEAIRIAGILETAMFAS